MSAVFEFPSPKELRNLRIEHSAMENFKKNNIEFLDYLRKSFIESDAAEMKFDVICNPKMIRDLWLDDEGYILYSVPLYVAFLRRFLIDLGYEVEIDEDENEPSKEMTVRLALD